MLEREGRTGNNFFSKDFRFTWMKENISKTKQILLLIDVTWDEKRRVFLIGNSVITVVLFFLPSLSRSENRLDLIFFSHNQRFSKIESNLRFERRILFSQTNNLSGSCVNTSGQLFNATVKYPSFPQRLVI